MLLSLWISIVLVAFAAAELQQHLVGESDHGKHYEDDDPYPKRPGRRRVVPELYHRRYSEQTFIGTHDSAAIRTKDNGWSISGNQYFTPAGALLASSVHGRVRCCLRCHLTELQSSWPVVCVYSKLKAIEVSMERRRSDCAILIVRSWMEVH